MKNLILLFTFLCLSFYKAIAQPEPDQFKTEKGMLEVQPVTHGSLILTWNNQTIFIDPYGGAKRYADRPAPDFILITDIHGDHLDLETLQNINTSKAKFIVPQAVADKLPEDLKSRTTILNNGDKTEQGGFKVKAIPMYNLPETEDSRHPKGRGNGYVLEMGGKNIYISGDTEDTKEMRDLDDIDIAFVCMNLPFTMDVQQAAAGVLAFKPKIVYPYHYRGQNGLSDVNEFKKLVDAGKKKIDVRLRNWYPEQ